MLSIIIPTLNEEKVIEKTLTLLKTYHGEHEVIVSDGKSKDRTIEISERLADAVVVYEGTVRQTIALARNMGVARAHGEFLLFLDADMHIPHIDAFLEKALSLFHTNPELVALTVPLEVFPEMSTFADRFFLGCFNTMVAFYNNTLHVGASPGEFQLMRRSAFEKVGGFNAKLVAGEDFDMFSKLSKIGQTRSESTLVAFHTGRRIHKVGWPKLLYSWFMNWFHSTFFNHSWSEVWEEVR